ncbi:MAG: VPLPA-CTERM sorting domain-containing protein [Methylococcales bacterium]
MTRFQKSNLIAIFTATVASSAQAALASSTANATFDWSSLTVQKFNAPGEDDPLVFRWLPSSPGAYYNYAYSQTGSASIEYFKDTNPSSTVAVTTAAEGYGMVDNNVIDVATISYPGIEGSFAYAEASTLAEFEIIGEGYVEISLDWSTSVTGEVGSDLFSAAKVTFLGGEQGSISDSLFYAIGSFSDGTGSNNGTFSLRFDSHDNNHFNGYILANAQGVSTGAIAPVPVPAAVWFLSSGLIGLVGYSRRKQGIA